MTTVSLTADIDDERKLTLTLPDEVLQGKVKLHITIEPLVERLKSGQERRYPNGRKRMLRVGAKG
jgi:hypothetical protein